MHCTSIFRKKDVMKLNFISVDVQHFTHLWHSSAGGGRQAGRVQSHFFTHAGYVSA